MAICKYCHTTMSKEKHARSHGKLCAGGDTKGRRHYLESKSGRSHKKEVI